jgi:hypothetical protein
MDRDRKNRGITKRLEQQVKINGCGLYVTSSSERSKLFKGVSANAFDVVLHRGPGFIAIPCHQCVDDGKMLLADFDDALRHSPDGKQLRALSEVFDNGSEHGISGCLRDQRMQIAADCAQVLPGRISTVLYAHRPCPQSFEISNGDLACSAPGCIPFEQMANLPDMKKIFDGHRPYHKRAAPLPLENFFPFQSPNRFPERCAGDIELPGKMSFQDHVVGAKFTRTKHANDFRIRDFGE